MENLVEIAKYILPALIVLATSYFMLQSFFNRETDRWKYELKKDGKKIITPLRLQAYERIVLFLERMAPESLLLRMNQPGMSSRQYQQYLLETIRTEFEHNMSQQIYISNRAWEAVKATKENIIKLINTAAGTVSPTSPSIELSKQILSISSKLEKSPVAAPIEFIKEEIVQFFE